MTFHGGLLLCNGEPKGTTFREDCTLRKDLTVRAQNDQIPVNEGWANIGVSLDYSKIDLNLSEFVKRKLFDF